MVDEYGDPEIGRFATDTVAETAAQRKKRLAEEARRRRERAGSNSVTDQSFADDYGDADDDFGYTDDEISESDLGREEDRPSEEWVENWEQEQADRVAQRNAEIENERLRKEREDQQERDRVAREQEDREEAARTGTPYVPQDRQDWEVDDPPLSEEDQIVERIRAYNEMDQSSRVEG